MKHFVLTRFSLRLPGFTARAGIEEADRPRWFAYRADILNGALVPSLRRQTRPTDGLLLLMDVDDRPLFDAHIGTHDGLVVPFFVEGSARIGTAFEEASAFLSTVGGSLVVSRIDSDDLVADTYVERVVESLAGAPPGDGPHFCVAAAGYRSDLRVIQTFPYDASPFISVLYRRFPGKLDLGGRHTGIAQRQPVVNWTAEWVQLVHGSNVVNDFHKRSVTPVTDSTWPAGIHRPDLAIFARADWRSPRLTLFSLRTGLRRLSRRLKGRLNRIRFGRIG